MSLVLRLRPLVFAPVEPAAQEGTAKALGLLGLRIYIGGALFVAHALPKLGELVSGHGHFPELVAQLGFPAPVLFAWLAALAQALGSLGIALGAFTRLSAIAALSTLLVGIVGVHWGDPFQIVEAGVAYLVVLGALSLLGPGPWSVDGRFS